MGILLIAEAAQAFVVKKGNVRMALATFAMLLCSG